jgi:hypothetical protein
MSSGLRLRMDKRRQCGQGRTAVGNAVMVEVQEAGSPADATGYL